MRKIFGEIDLNCRNRSYNYYLWFEIIAIEAAEVIMFTIFVHLISCFDLNYSASFN